MTLRAHLGRIVLLGAVCGGAAAAGLHAQTTVNSDPANPTTRNRNTSVTNAGPIVLPDDYASLRLDHAYSLQLEVFGIPEMGQEIRVDDDGNVMIPLVGPVQVEGETLREAEQQIARLLVEHQLLNAPTVSLRLIQFPKQSVTVSGEVQNPGKVQVLAPRSLLDVLSLAGGLTSSAGGRVEIRHHDPRAGDTVTVVSYTSGKDSTTAQAALVYPGDNVYVQRAGVVYVLGAVQRPGGYLMVVGGTLTVPQAIALASGTTPVASSKEVLIVRNHEGSITRSVVPFTKEERGDAPVVQLADGDMLYVPTSKVKAALVNSSAVLSSAVSAGIVAGVQGR